MPADSLSDMSLRACSKIVKRIRDIGGMPYSLARPFLLKIENPEQLRALEERCEQIVGHDAEIWLALIKRDIPNWQNKRHEPTDPHNWWKVYRKLKQESMQEMDADAEKLQAALHDKNEKHVAEIKSLKALPRSQGPSFQQRAAFGYQSGKTGSKGGSKMSLLEKIRKETRDARHARAIAEEYQRKRAATTVTRAPAQFVEDLRTQQRPQRSPERPTPRPPTGSQRIDTSTSSPSKVASSPAARPAVMQQQIEEREARLRALTSGKPLPSNTFESALPRNDLAVRDIPVISVERPSTPLAASELTSASLLEEPSPASVRGDAMTRPGSSNGSRSASPQIAKMMRKRKREPDIFMAPAKRKTVAAGGNSGLQ